MFPVIPLDSYALIAWLDKKSNSAQTTRIQMQHRKDVFIYLPQTHIGLTESIVIVIFLTKKQTNNNNKTQKNVQRLIYIEQ